MRLQKQEILSLLTLKTKEFVVILVLFQKIKHLSVKKTRVKIVLAFVYPLHTTVRLVVNPKTN